MNECWLIVSESDGNTSAVPNSVIIAHRTTHALGSFGSVAGGLSAIRNVWSAAVLQAKKMRKTELVSANVSGLCWSSDLLA